ncbi:MAG: glycosyltransferase [Treponema sp.]|nr:glycosyltransferase [Treponema sp.]
MFSIVIPTYKRDEDLEECLQSIRENSTDKNIEVIVLHGGFESTAAVCEKYGALSVLDHARENGKRVKSLWAIINDGIKMAKSQYVLYLNDDCLVMPGWDSICAKYFEDKKTGLLVCRSKGIGQDPNFRIIRTLFFDFPCANYAILNKETGVLFDENYNWYWGDGDYPLELAYRTDYKIAESTEDLIIHNHKIDESRLQHDTSPNVILDEQYHRNKWADFKRKGNRVVRKTKVDHLVRKAKNVAKLILKKLKERKLLVTEKKISRKDNRLRYYVYGYSSNDPDFVKNYYFKDFLCLDDTKLRPSPYKPQIRFFEVHGGKNVRNQIKKMPHRFTAFMTGECVKSNMLPNVKYYADNCLNDADVSLGFDVIESDHYERYPYWLLCHFKPTMNRDEIAAKVKEFNSRKFEKTDFASLIASHDYSGIRENMVDAFSAVGKVKCPGKFRFNDGELKLLYNDSKEEYLKHFMFNLCPENDAVPEYVTEKIFDAFWAGAIPVYNGGDRNPEPEVINPEAFIFYDPENPQEAIAKVKELYENKNAYEEFMKKPKLLDSSVDWIYEKMQSVYKKYEIVLKQKALI